MNPILNKIFSIISPIIGFFILFLILSGIYCLIFGISFNEYMVTIFWPFIGMIYSIFYIIYQLLYIPVVIYNFIVKVVFTIFDTFAFVINIFNNISNFMYDTTNDNLL